MVGIHDEFDVRLALKMRAKQSIDFGRFSSEVRTALDHYEHPAPRKTKPPKSVRTTLKTEADGKPCLICEHILHHREGERFGSWDRFAATVEHKLPMRLGGGHQIENLTGQVCNSCNRARGHVLSRGIKRPWTAGDITLYVRWLMLQLEDACSAMLIFPDLHHMFAEEWKNIVGWICTTGDAEYQIQATQIVLSTGSPTVLNGSVNDLANEPPRVRYRPARDMSASARSKRRKESLRQTSGSTQPTTD